MKTCACGAPIEYRSKTCRACYVGSDRVVCDCGGVKSREAKQCRACWTMPTRDIVDELRLLAYETPERAAQRLGLTTAALARRLYRAGLPDLARPFAAAQKRQASRKAAA